MAMKSIQPLAFPEIRSSNAAGAGADATLQIDASDEAGAVICQAEVTDSIIKVRFRCRTFTSNSTIEVRIETVTSGAPSGTLLGTDSNGTVSVTAIGDYEVTLTTPVAVTRGDILAVVVKQPTAGFGNINLTCLQALTSLSFPRNMQRITGSWVFNRAQCLAVTIEYSTAGIVNQVNPGRFFDDQALTRNQSTSPNEQGTKFIFPGRVRVRGAIMRTGTATGNLVFSLYDSADTEIATYTLLAALVDTANGIPTTVLFPNSVTLEANQVYRLTYRSSNNSNVIGFQTRFDTANDLRAFVETGTIISTWRTGAGAWSDSDLGLVWIGLLIDGIEFADYPAVGKVRDGTTFDAAALTGNLVLPAITDVATGVLYGTLGTELEGTLAAGGGGGGRIIGVNA